MLVFCNTTTGKQAKLLPFCRSFYLSEERQQIIMSAEMQTCPSCGELVPNEYVICVFCAHDLTAEKIRRAGIHIDNRAAVERMQRVVRDPLKTFREISLLPDLRGGKIILYAIAIMMTFNMITIFSKLDGMRFNEDLGGITIIGSLQISTKFIINLIILIVQPLVLFGIFMVMWKASGRVLALLSRSFGGRGDREKIRAVIGYSLLPVFFGWTLAWLMRLLAPHHEVASLTYDSVSNSVVAVAEQGIGFVGILFIWAGWLWSLGLAILGMREVGKLSWVEAVIVTGIPYAIFMSIIL